MKKFINIRKRINPNVKASLVIYFLIILLGILACAPLFRMNLSEYNEFRIHISRIVSVKEIIKDGVFPPFISAKHMLGYGYALNIFYGVFTTYIPVLISLFTKTSTIALKIFTILSVVFSGITMYKFTLKITGKKFAGLISALVYMAAPYKLCDIYSRNAVGEYVSFIFIPMVFQGIYMVINREKGGNLILIIGASLLILTHTITTVYVALFSALYILFNINKIKNKDVIKEFALDILMILLLTAFYTLPIIEHKIYGDYSVYDKDLMNTSGIDVYQVENTNTIGQWFEREIKPGLNFSFGLSITILTFLTIFCYKKIKDEKTKNNYLIFGILAIISLYMTTRAFPWWIMPQILSIIQFAWRLNGFFLFFISFICGVNAYVFCKYIIKNEWLRNSFVIFIVLLTFTMSTLNAVKNGSVVYNEEKDIHEKAEYDKEKEKNYEDSLIKAKIIGPYRINRDYLPAKACRNLDYMINRYRGSIVIDGNAEISEETKESLKDKIEIKNVENAEIELPYIYYHGYSTKINGKNVKNYESENGFLTVKVNEPGTVSVEYTGTIAEKIAMVISALTLIMIIVYLILKNIKRKGKEK